MKTIIVPPLTYNPGQETISGTFSLGALTVATILSREGFDVNIVNPTAVLSDIERINIKNSLAKIIVEKQPDVIAFSTMCELFELTILVAKRCKELLPNVLIIFGGPQASLVSLHLLEGYSFIDFVYVGEADKHLVALWECFDCDLGGVEEIPGLQYVFDGSVKINRPANQVLDLDQLPILEYGLMPNELFDKEKYVPLEAGRGCPFSCAYCSTSIFWGRSFRLKSPKRIVTEMNTISREKGKKHFSLQHDMLTTDRKRVAELCEELVNGQYGFTWGCSSRPDFLDSSLIAKMHESGCREIFIGAESASLRVQKVIGKKISPSNAYNVVGMISEHKQMRVVVSMMLGFPDETPEEMAMTLNYAFKLKRKYGASVQVEFSILAPLPQTKLSTLYGDRIRYDKRKNPSFSIVPFSIDECEEMTKECQQVFLHNYYIDNENFSRQEILKIFYIFTCLIDKIYTLELIYRLWSGDFVAEIFSNLTKFKLEKIVGLSSIDEIEFQTNVLLTHILSNHNNPAPYFQDLFAYESAILRLKRTSHEESQQLSLKINYDIRKIGELFGSMFEIPVLEPLDEPIYLMCSLRNNQFNCFCVPSTIYQTFNSHKP